MKEQRKKKQKNFTKNKKKRSILPNYTIDFFFSFAEYQNAKQNKKEMNETLTYEEQSK